MESKAPKKRYYFTLGAFVVGIFLAFLVLRSANSYNWGIFAPIISYFGYSFTIVIFVLGLPLITFLVERRFVRKEEIEAKKRAKAIAYREEVRRKAEEAKRREEEDRRIAEANAELWSERWESYIKPILKFALVACVVLVVGGIIVSAASAFIGAFGMVAFLLLLILIFK